MPILIVSIIGFAVVAALTGVMYVVYRQLRSMEDENIKQRETNS